MCFFFRAVLHRCNCSSIVLLLCIEAIVAVVPIMTMTKTLFYILPVLGLLLVVTPEGCCGFGSFGRQRHGVRSRLLETAFRRSFLLPTRAVAIDVSEVDNATTTATAVAPNDDISMLDQFFKNQENYENIQQLDFILENHKPLGCTVEESLSQEEDGKTHHVFVVKLVEGGNAEKGGLRVGDVVLGVTGTFGDVQAVGGLGLEHVKSLVSACPKDNPLQIVVARGTDVMERHETALVDLCTFGGPGSAMDNQVQECVQTIHSMAYSELDDVSSINENEQQCNSEDECELLDSMFDLWAEDLPEGSTTTSKQNNNDNEEEWEPVNGDDKKPAPWSSRSSPSGTYVRDPATGEMRNIDK